MVLRFMIKILHSSSLFSSLLQSPSTFDPLNYFERIHTSPIIQMLAHRYPLHHQKRISYCT